MELKKSSVILPKNFTNKKIYINLLTNENQSVILKSKKVKVKVEKGAIMHEYVR